jgi:hypothetical protein
MNEDNQIIYICFIKAITTSNIAKVVTFNLDGGNDEEGGGGRRKEVVWSFHIFHLVLDRMVEVWRVNL